MLLASLVLTECTWSQSEDICFSKQQRCGVLSTSGDTIIPFRFQNIALHQATYYIAHRKLSEGKKAVFKMSIFDRKGNQVLPGEYDWIYSDTTHKYIKYYRDGSTSILETVTQKTITRKGVYNVDSYLNYGGNESPYRYTEFTSENGSEVFTATFESLFTTTEYIRGVIRFSVFNPEKNVYRFGDPNSDKYGFINGKGEVIIPEVYESFESSSGPFSIFRNDTCYIAKRGDKYDFYPGIYEKPITGFKYLQFWEHRMIAKKGNKWILFDEELNEIFSDSKHGLSFHSGHFNPVEFNYENMIFEGSEFYSYNIISGLRPESDFVFQVDFGKPKKAASEWVTYSSDKQGSVGLTNIKTKQSIPVKYTYLIPLIYSADSLKQHLYYSSISPEYFWAIKAEPKNAKLALTIFDNQLQEMCSYNLCDRSLQFLRKDIRNSGDTMTKILENDKGFYGMLRADGSVKVPFEYSRLYYHRPHNNNYVEHLCFGTDEHYGLFDPDGNNLLPVQYDTIYYPNRYNWNFVVAEQGENFTLYLNSTNEQIDGVSEFFTAKIIKKIGSNEYYYNSNGNSYYFIKNGLLFAMDPDGVTLMDENRMYMTHDKMRVFNGQIIIDRSGKVLKNTLR